MIAVLPARPSPMCRSTKNAAALNSSGSRIGGAQVMQFPFHSRQNGDTAHSPQSRLCMISRLGSDPRSHNLGVLQFFRRNCQRSRSDCTKSARIPGASKPILIVFAQTGVKRAYVPLRTVRSHKISAANPNHSPMEVLPPSSVERVALLKTFLGCLRIPLTAQHSPLPSVANVI